MIKLLDRYIMREWGRAFVLGVCGMLGLLVIADMLDDLGNYIGWGAGWQEILGFYVMMVPSFLPVVVPVGLLLSLLFTLGNLHRNSEVTAMRASGMGLWRISRSLWFCGVILAGVMLWVNGGVIPRAVEESRRMERWMKYKGEAREVEADEVGLYYNLGFDNRKGGRVWFINRWSEYSGRGYGIVVYERDGHMKEVKRIMARSGEYDKEKGEWVMREGREVEFDVLSGDPVRSKSFGEKRYGELDESPELLIAMQTKPGHLSLMQLEDLLDRVDYRYNPTVVPYAVAYHGVLASPFLCLIALVAGIPFVIGTVRGNALYGVVKALGVFFSYFVLVSFFKVLALEGWVNPAVAAWSPGLIVMGLCLYYFRE